MAAHTVATADEYHVPAVWVVWNNGGYVSIRDLQVGAFGPRELATRFRDSRTGDLVSTDFAALARAMGADGYRVEKPGDFGEALAAALASNGPSVIDVPVQADERPVATGGWVLPLADAPCGAESVSAAHGGPARRAPRPGTARVGMPGRARHQRRPTTSCVSGRTSATSPASDSIRVGGHADPAQTVVAVPV
jgi:hypothetical protein